MGPLGVALLFFAGIAGLFLSWFAFAWVVRAIVGLIYALVRAPFSAAARADLMALRFLRHPFFIILGGHAPTGRMQDLARQVARERGIELPPATLRSFGQTRQFLNDHSRAWLPPSRW